MNQNSPLSQTFKEFWLPSTDVAWLCLVHAASRGVQRPEDSTAVREIASCSISLMLYPLLVGGSLWDVQVLIADRLTQLLPRAWRLSHSQLPYPHSLPRANPSPLPSRVHPVTRAHNQGPSIFRTAFWETPGCRRSQETRSFRILA